MDNLYSERFYHHYDVKTFLVGLLYTIIMDTSIAVFLTLTGIFETAITLKTFVIILLISQSYGISTYVIIMIFLWAFKPQKGASFAFIVLIGIACGILLGSPMKTFILQQSSPTYIWEWKKTFLKTIVICLVFGIVIGYFFYSKTHLKISKEIIQQERVSRLSSEKQALEANLRLLQAQIEPHFLFNTLSNILSLLDSDLRRGKSMLVDLIHYLRTSLTKAREETATIGQEIEMIRAYLNIFAVRMEDRLRYRIEVPDAMKVIPFPPMLLQPLVENAVKHGIEPKIEGGEITIRAQVNGNILRVEVADTGTGFHEDSNVGFGISNVRERLQSLYGDRGRLILEENRPSGLKAIIEVPYGTGQGDHRR